MGETGASTPNMLAPMENRYAGSKREVKGHFQLGGILEVTWNGHVFDLIGQLKRYFDQGKRAVNVAKDFAEWIGPRLQALGGCKLTFFWPMISVTGQWGWEEVKESPRAGFAGSLTIGINPLIGVEAKVDLLLAACNAMPGLAAALTRWKYFWGEDDENNSKNLCLDLTLT